MIGQTFSNYKVESKLGSGGMGVVYKALDQHLQRPVALKFLAPHIGTDEEAKKRFMQEARAASALDHPNICTIFGISETPEEQLFIVMPFYEGETLKKKIEEGPIDAREATLLAIQLAEGLRAAHNIGVVHRDVKPANVIITPNGHAKILDFGLAKIASHQLTRTGSTMGTAAYMSPEQAGGEQVDHRTDIWSLGVVLYEMLSGFRPFGGNHAQSIIYSILHKTPEALSLTCPDAPRNLIRITEKLLNKDLSKRYQHMDQVLQDLYDVSLEMGTDPRLTLHKNIRPEHSIERRPFRKTLAYIMAAVLFLSLVAFAWFFYRQPTVSPFVAIDGLAVEPEWSPDGKWIVFSSDESGNSDIWKQHINRGDRVRITTSPRNESSPTWSPDGETIAYSLDAEGGGIFSISADGGLVNQLASFGKNPVWAPATDRIAFDWNGDIYTVSASGGVPALIVTGTSSTPFMTWTPDGDRLIFWNRTKADVFAVDVETGESTALELVPSGEEVSGISLSRDGRILVYSRGQFGGAQNLWKVPIDPATLKPEGIPEMIDLPTGDNVDCVFSPNGKQLAYTARQLDRDLMAFAIDPVTGLARGTPERITFRGDLSLYPNLSPDGRSLVWTSQRSGSGRARIMEIESREDLRITGDTSVGLEASDAEIREVFPVFAPDGRQIAYSSTLNGSYEIWRIPFVSARSIPITRTEHPLRDTGPAWSPDGNTIVFYSNRSNNWDIWTVEALGSARPVQLTDWESNEMYPSWSPDGQKIAFRSDRGGNADIWIMDRDGSDPEAYVSHPAEEGWPAWSPIGDHFYFVSNRSGTFNIWMISENDPEPRQVTHYRDPAEGLSDNVLFTKFAVSSTRLFVPVESRKGSIYMVDGI